MLDASAPISARRLSESPWRSSSSSRARDLSLVRAPLRGHDLMCRSRSKSMPLQALPDRRAAGRVRDASRVDVPRGQATHGAGASPGATRRSGRCADVSFELERGRGARRDRPQRGRQVDAAEDPDADHDAHDGARRDPRPRREPARGRDRLPSRADRPRERLPERRDPRHEAPRDRRASSTRSSSSPASRSSSTRP